MLIKICGIRDPEIAAFAAKEGADFIGMVLTPGFHRSISLDQAKKIVKAAKVNNAVPVGVFVSESAFQIASTCHFLDLDVVQAYHLSEVLPEHLKRIFINEPHVKLRLHCDFLLMETDHPGSGTKLDFDRFLPPQAQPWIMAGGLTSENVKMAIQRFQPDGVDVSSGVEKNGKKSSEMILKFIQEARSCE